jgi:hypothetical protein
MKKASIAILLVIALVTPASAQWIYVSDQPEVCKVVYNFEPMTLHVYAHAGSETTIGASFRIESANIGPEDVISVTPSSGVTILSGNLFDGLTLSWPPHTLDHEPVLTLEVGTGFVGIATSTDIVFWQPTGSHPGESTATFVGSMFPHCFTPWAGWQVADTCGVGIDGITEFTIKAIVFTESSYGGTLSVVDNEGWVTGLSSSAIPNACWECPWQWGVIDIIVAVPDTVAPQTLNTIVLQCTHVGNLLDEVNVVLRALEPVATETTSFGKLKAMYRKQTQERK